MEHDGTLWQQKIGSECDYVIYADLSILHLTKAGVFWTTFWKILVSNTPVVSVFFLNSSVFFMKMAGFFGKFLSYFETLLNC